MIRWQIFSAVALRQLPEVYPRADELVTRIQDVFARDEIARSRLSNHELQHLKDQKQPESDVVVTETAQDKLDSWIQHKATFEFAPYDERLTKIRYLFVNQKFGSDIKEQWLLPQAAYDSKSDNDLLDTGRRAIKDLLNIATGYKIVSKVPSSVYSFRYPKKVVQLTGYDGARVFFLKAQLDGPDKQVQDAINEGKHKHLKWVTRDEARSIARRRYVSNFETGLLHDNRVNPERVLDLVARYGSKLAQRQQLVANS